VPDYLKVSIDYGQNILNKKTVNTAARHSFQPGQLHLIFNFNDISMPEFNFNQAVLISAGLA
jgi:hypothetical protein